MFWWAINGSSLPQWKLRFRSAASRPVCARICAPQMHPYLEKVLVISGMTYFHIGLERNITALKFTGLSSLHERVSVQMEISCSNLYSTWCSQNGSKNHLDLMHIIQRRVTEKSLIWTRLSYFPTQRFSARAASDGKFDTTLNSRRNASFCLDVLWQCDEGSMISGF